MGKRLAVLVGCNYPGTKEELKGSINNAWLWRHLLCTRFGFKGQDITLMTDDDGGVMPTRENILNALRNMFSSKVEPGDIFFFHFSGHGKLPSDNPAIVASDLQNLVTDLDFQQLVNGVPMNASFIILADCSHSGGLIYGEKPQIAPEPPVPYQPDAGILLSACQKMENSKEIDEPVPGQGNITYGAFTCAVKNVLQNHPNAIINKDLVTLAGAELKNLGIRAQNPCLYCNDANAGVVFLHQPTTTS